MVQPSALPLKYFYLFGLSLLLFTACKKEQINQVYDGTLEIFQQSDIPNLAPGTTINGDLKLHFEDDPTIDISALENVTTVLGELYLGAKVNDEHLEALAAIEYVGSLTVQGNNELTDLTPLTNLDIREDIVIAFTNIETIPGFYQTTSISGDLVLRGNSSLKTLAGSFHGMENVAGTVWIIDHPVLEWAEMAGLQEAGHLMIEENPMLETIQFFELHRVKGNLMVRQAGKIEHLAGLNNLNRVNGTLTISENPQLKTLAAGLHLDFIFGVNILDNANLSNFCMLQDLAIQNGISGYQVFDNAYNPTLEQLQVACFQ